MVKNKFAVVTLTSLALSLNAGVVCAEEDAALSMDNGFGADSVFDFDTDKPAQQAEVASAEQKDATPVAAEQVAAEPAPQNDVAPTPVAQSVDNANAQNAAPVQEDVFASDMNVAFNQKEAAVPASERMLGSVDSTVFREMADIERENALLELKSKKEKLLSDIESFRASQRRNQLEELERREQITRNRINWEVEQAQNAEIRALETEKMKREMERQQRMEEERIAKEKEMAEVAKLAGNTGIEEEDITTLYTVEEVRGVGGDLYAVLASDNGTVNVREGYPLKNGFKVSKVTTSFVEVKRGSKTEMLRFGNSGDSSSTSSRQRRR